MLPLLNEICREYGVLELEYEKDAVKCWDPYQHGPDFYKNQISADIDRMIEKASHYEQWKQLLVEAGYEIKEGKYLALKPPGGKRFHRTYQYGEAYTEEGIKKRIEGRGISPTKEQLKQYKQRFSQKYDIVPYGLTEYQKQYKRRLYRLGVLQYAPFSVAYRYRLEIRKLDKYQAELDYLLEHNITDRIGVDTRKSEVENAMKTLRKERKKLYQRRKDKNSGELLRKDVNSDESL